MEAVCPYRKLICRNNFFPGGRAGSVSLPRSTWNSNFLTFLFSAWHKLHRHFMIPAMKILFNGQKNVISIKKANKGDTAGSFMQTLSVLINSSKSFQCMNVFHFIVTRADWKEKNRWGIFTTPAKGCTCKTGPREDSGVLVIKGKHWALGSEWSWKLKSIKWFLLKNWKRVTVVIVIFGGPLTARGSLCDHIIAPYYLPVSLARRLAIHTIAAIQRQITWHQWKKTFALVVSVVSVVIFGYSAQTAVNFIKQVKFNRISNTGYKLKSFHCIVNLYSLHSKSYKKIIEADKATFGVGAL